jgi:hypothetical protein
MLVTKSICLVVRLLLEIREQGEYGGGGAELNLVTHACLKFMEVLRKERAEEANRVMEQKKNGTMENRLDTGLDKRLRWT